MSLKIEPYKKKNSSKTFYRATGYMGTNQKTGERKYFNRQGFKTKMDAKDAFDKAVSDFKDATTIVEKQPRKKFKEVEQEWWKDYQKDVSGSSVLTIEAILRLHILPDLGEYFIDSIKILDAEKWAHNLAREYSSYRKACYFAGTIMRYGVRAGYINSNPFDYIQPARKVKKPHHVVKQNWYSLSELQTFIQKVKDMPDNVFPKEPWINPMVQAFLFVIVSSGVRVGEACVMRWSKINWETATIEVEQTATRQKNGEKIVHAIGPTKTESGIRTVPIDGVAIDALKYWHTQQIKLRALQDLPEMGANDWIFTKPRDLDHSLLTGTGQQWMKQVCEHTGIRPISLHGLRHTKATLLGEAGAELADIAAILGHSDGRFTLSHYMHPTAKGVVHAESLFRKYLAQ